MDYVKLGLFRVIAKISEVIYRLNLLVKIKIYPIQHIIILELAYKDIELLVYELDTYGGQEEDK